MIASNIVSTGKLEFINKKSISKINLGFRIFLALLSALVLFVVFKDTMVISTITIYVVIASIMIYNQSNGFNRIDLSEIPSHLLIQSIKRRRHFRMMKLQNLKV